jgi:hypothetical protein
MNGMPSFADPANLEPRIDLEAIEVAADLMPREYFLAIMRDPKQPPHRRDKAAREAAPYCHAKLAVTAQVNSEDFAAAMERAT